jgi:hypothetical protein
MEFLRARFAALRPVELKTVLLSQHAKTARAGSPCSPGAAARESPPHHAKIARVGDPGACGARKVSFLSAIWHG